MERCSSISGSLTAPSTNNGPKRVAESCCPGSPGCKHACMCNYCKLNVLKLILSLQLYILKQYVCYSINSVIYIHTYMTVIVMYVFIFHIWSYLNTDLKSSCEPRGCLDGEWRVYVSTCCQVGTASMSMVQTCQNMSKPICWVLFWTSITIVRNNWKMQQNTNITHKMHMKITHPCSRHVFCPLILRRVFQRAQNKTLDRSLLRSSRCIWVFINVERVCDRFWVLTTC
jgi:hypothetical protein